MGPLRCILLYSRLPESFEVQVLNDARALVKEPCDDADEAIHLAARFQLLFSKVVV